VGNTEDICGQNLCRILKWTFLKGKGSDWVRKEVKGNEQ
jgi:hypothetical protein